jgi:hypothetical protein
MAVTEQRQLYAPQIEALAEQYGTAMGDIAGRPLTGAQITSMAPQVAGQTGLQAQATTLAGQVAPGGIAAYAPYVAAAGAAGTTAGGILGAAGTELTGAGTTLGGVSQYIGAAGTGLGGAGTAMGDVSQYVTGAAGLTGPMTGAQMATIDPTTGQTVTPTLAAGSYMSPYQQQVIDTTLSEFDKQAAIRQQAISDAAVGIGGYGGGREGVMQSEYQLGSDKNRAMLQAQLQQQGYTQAQAAKQADMMARLGIGGAQQQYATGLAGLAGQQLGLGQATGALAGQQAGMAGQRAGLGQAQLGLGQYQTGLAGTTQALRQADIGTLGRVGAADQAYAQAVKDAERERQRMAIYEPYERMGYIGSGLSGLMQGMGPQYQFQTQANPSPLATALGIGATVGGIYGDVTYGPR